MADPRVPRGRKLMLGALAACLAFPLDLIPDWPGPEASLRTVLRLTGAGP